jgi:hypothetical protein
VTIGPTPACMACIRFHTTGPGLTCDAYPAGIPDIIVLTGVLHTAPYPGDGGLTFAPADGFTRNADGSVDGPEGLHWDRAGAVP